MLTLIDIETQAARIDALCSHVHGLSAALLIMTGLAFLSLCGNVVQSASYSDSDRAALTALIDQSANCR